MCLILLAIKMHPEYKMIIAANRDEYYDRASAPAHFWEQAPVLLAGRDMKAGGTWLGITRQGRLGMVTNYRDPASVKQHAPSRGRLLTRFLLAKLKPLDFLREVKQEGDQYNGLNLIVGDENQLYWFSNRNGDPLALGTGLYGLSNHLLDTPWPKVSRAKNLMAQLLAGREILSPDPLFKSLQDRSVPPDKALPHTGVDLEWERLLSPIFISSPNYGTRSSTVLLIDQQDRVTFVERTFNGSPKPTSSVMHEFKLG
ncbi:MAG: NRDE family protein [Deltaproteobacteria bacterium]